MKFDFTKNRGHPGKIILVGKDTQVGKVRLLINTDSRYDLLHIIPDRPVLRHEIP